MDFDTGAMVSVGILSGTEETVIMVVSGMEKSVSLGMDFETGVVISMGIAWGAEEIIIVGMVAETWVMVFLRESLVWEAETVVLQSGIVTFTLVSDATEIWSRFSAGVSE